MSNYQTLRAINVNGHTEKKNGLTYLSWAWAWDIFKQQYPEATYKIIKAEDGTPYFETKAGVMVYTEVTADNITHEMWLPVMDGANNAMKSDAYEYDTKYGKKKVDAFDMFDVNKTIMRCLVKNLAMFGLGIYIFAGEDLPEEDKIPVPQKVTPTAGAGETLDDETKQWVINEAMEIMADIESGNVEAAHDRASLVTDSDQKVFLWSKLGSKERSAIKKYAESLKGSV